MCYAGHGGMRRTHARFLLQEYANMKMNNIRKLELIDLGPEALANALLMPCQLFGYCQGPG
jgi:hypothetical protein